MRNHVLLLVVLAPLETVAAHDFWVQPQVFAAAVGAPVPVTILVGHGAARQRWSAGIDRVASFTSAGPDGVADRRGELTLNAPGADATLRFARPGTYAIVLTTNPASSVLPAIRFNDYLTVEGITSALAARKAAGTTDTPGRELYSRRAKALVQIGTASGPQPQVTRPLGLTLEIVPEADPYAIAPDAPLPVRVLYEGKPLAGALVKLNNLDFDARPVATHLTDAAGRATFAVPFRGLWQMNVIWSKPLKGNPDADFATVFSSLTFGTARSGRPVAGR